MARGREGGQGSTEYVGILAVVALVVTAVALAAPGRVISGAMDRAVCTITGGPCEVAAAEPAEPTVTQGGLASQPGGPAGPAPRFALVSEPWEPWEPWESSQDGRRFEFERNNPPDPWGVERFDPNGYDTDAATPLDAMRWNTANTFAQVARARGYGNASDLLGHFLMRSGEDLYIDADDLVGRNDMTPWRETDLLRAAAQAYRRGVLDRDLQSYERPVDLHFTTEWSSSEPADGDWASVLDTYTWADSGTLVFTPARDGRPASARLYFRTYVVDTYNGRDGVDLGPGVQLYGHSLGELYRAGLARNYTFRGVTSETREVELDPQEIIELAGRLPPQE